MRVAVLLKINNPEKSNNHEYTNIFFLLDSNLYILYIFSLYSSIRYEILHDELIVQEAQEILYLQLL